MNKTWIWGGVVFILVLIIVGGGVYFLKPEWLGKKTTSTSPTGTVVKISDAKASEYSAVFISNNQVYFGKVSDLNAEFATLREVYYLKIQNSLVPPQEGDVKVEGKDSQPQQKNELTLIKMGNELHGPTDEIKINNKHILYIEALKTDSKVVKAINDYKAKNK
mgnify:CR=1 FL=1